MTTALLFDLDDTLIVDDAATEAAVLAAGAEICACHGIAPLKLYRSVRAYARRLWEQGPVFPYCHAIGISAAEGLWGHFRGHQPDLTPLRAWVPAYRREVWSRALADLGAPDAGLAEGLAGRFGDERRARQALFPETLAVLRLLRASHKIALVTNGAPDLQREKIAALALEPLFDTIVVSGEVGVGKPDPHIFALALERLGASTDAVMVGDKLGRDVAGAHATGLRGIWINRAGERPDGTDGAPDAEIRSLHDLPEVLNHLDRKGPSPTGTAGF